MSPPPLAEKVNSFISFFFVDTLDRKTMISLRVPDDFILPFAFHKDDPQTNALLLNIVGSIPNYLKEKAAAQDATKNTAEATASAVLTNLRSTSMNEVLRLTKELMECKNTIANLEKEVKKKKSDLVEDVTKESAQERDNERSMHNSQIRDYESRICSLLQSQCETERQHHEETQVLNKTISELRCRTSELTTPTGLGRSGEIDVINILQSYGFKVEDTTQTGKHVGFLDLVVTRENDPETRLVVEVKNKNPVKKQDLDEFRRKSEVLFSEKKAEGALFLSIRAHVKCDDMLEIVTDDGGRPVNSMAWLGTEKTRMPDPLTAEQISTIVFVQFSIIDKCADMRKNLCDTRASDVTGIQQMVRQLIYGLSCCLDKLSDQEKLIDRMRQNLTEQRVQLILNVYTMWQNDRDIPWLSGMVSVPWMDTFLTALTQTNTLKDSEIWNKLSNKKALIERTIGKDALFLSLKKCKRPRENISEE